MIVDVAMTPTPRVFAVVPAAGHSRRMGRPKLLLSLRGELVISRLLKVLQPPPVEDVVVVVRRSDTELAAAVKAAGGTVVTPETDPPDMRSSVVEGLRSLDSRFSPADSDVWLLVPADYPLLEPAVLPELLAAWSTMQSDILLPTYHGQRGHPALFRWGLVTQINALPPDRGLNTLRDLPGIRVIEHEVTCPGVTLDLDTLDDWERLNRLVDRKCKDFESFENRRK
jgi:molybdenum cofactor cytidylyltransferase